MSHISLRALRITTLAAALSLSFCLLALPPLQAGPLQAGPPPQNKAQLQGQKQPAIQPVPTKKNKTKKSPERAELHSLQYQLRRAVETCGGPIEAAKTFRSQGILFSSSDIKLFFNRTIELKKAQKMYPTVKKIINQKWPLSPHSLIIQAAYKGDSTKTLTLYALSQRHHDPYIHIIKKHLPILIRRYNHLKEFATRHRTSPAAISYFLDPDLRPDIPLLKKVFQIFHAENYTRLYENENQTIDSTKSLSEFSTRSITIPIFKDNYWPPKTNNSKKHSLGNSNQPQKHIQIYINDRPFMKNNFHHMVRYLLHLAIPFKGRDKFATVMSHHYQFNSEKQNAVELHKKIGRWDFRYKKPPYPTPQPHNMFLLFELIEKTQEHLQNNRSLQVPTDAQLKDASTPPIVLHIPDHNLSFSTANMEHIKSHILTITHYYRHMAFHLVPGGPQQLARALNLNLGTLYRHIHPKKTPLLKPSGLKTMLQNIVRTQQLVQNKDLLNKKLKQHSSDLADRQNDLQIPSPQGPLQLSLNSLEHIAQHHEDLKRYIRHIAQHFGNVREILRIVGPSQPNPITNKDISNFINSKPPFRKSTYARVFELIKKSQPYLKKSPDEIQKLIADRKQQQQAFEVSFIWKNKTYTLNLQQGRENLHTLRQYLNQQIDNLFEGNQTLFASTININRMDLLHVLSATKPRPNTIKRLFYCIQEAQKLKKNKNSTRSLVAEAEPTTVVTSVNASLSTEASRWPPLHQAVRHGDPVRLRQAIEKHIADLNAVAPDTDETPLHWAAFADDVQSVEILLEAGASMQATQNGLYPLQDAVRAGSLPVIKAFIKHGAPLDIISQKSNLLDIALSRHHFLNLKVQSGFNSYQADLDKATEVLEFLKQQGLKPLYYQSHKLTVQSLTGPSMTSPLLLNSNDKSIGHGDKTVDNKVSVGEDDEFVDTIVDNKTSAGEGDKTGDNDKPFVEDEDDALRQALQKFKDFHNKHDFYGKQEAFDGEDGSTGAGLYDSSVFESAQVRRGEAEVFHQLNQALSQATRYQKPNCFELLDDGNE